MNDFLPSPGPNYTQDDQAIRHVKTVDLCGVEGSGVVHTARDAHIDDLTRQLLVESVPENTRDAYSRVRAQYGAWCESTGRIALPAHAATFTSYVSYLIAHEASPATISQHMGAIRTMHAVAGFTNQPHNVDALQLLRGWRRTCADAGLRERKATPLVRDDLRLVISRLDRGTLAGRRDHLLLVLGFAMMARRSELAALTIADVQETEKGIAVAVRRSKTDQQARGTSVALPHGRVPDLDAPKLAHAWIAELVGRGVVDGPLLRTVDRNGNLGGALRPSSVNTIVRRAVKAAGLPHHDTYSAHSLRAGGLTSALAKGALLGVAAEHGRWSKKSPVVLEYARTVDQWRDNAMKDVL